MLNLDKALRKISAVTDIFRNFVARLLSRKITKRNHAYDKLIRNMNIVEEQTLSKIVDKAKSVAPKDATIMLYGSRARGDNRNDSDWDLLILVNKDKITLNDIDEVEYPLREMGWIIGEDINPILYTKKEWNDNSFTPFYKNVTHDCITL